MGQGGVLLQPEDVVDNVAYGGELHEGPDHSDTDVLLQIQPLVEAQGHRHGHKPEGEQGRANGFQTFHS